MPTTRIGGFHIMNLMNFMYFVLSMYIVFISIVLHYLCTYMVFIDDRILWFFSPYKGIGYLSYIFLGRSTVCSIKWGILDESTTSESQDI
jgi:hypothetical protein